MWFTVIIDDWLPCDDEGLVGIRNTDPNEMWAPLLEKAFAKLHYGYDRLEGGSFTAAIADLTGGVCHSIFISSHQRAKEIVADNSYKDTLRGYLLDQWMVFCNAKTDSSVERASLKEVGITANQSYEVVGYAETENWEVVQIYFPHGEEVPEYNNNSSSSSTSLWLSQDWLRSLPESEYRRLFVRMGDPDPRYRWMTFQNFAIFFNKVYICRVLAEQTRNIYRQERVVGRWLGTTAGGRLRSQYFTENPAWCLRVKEKNTAVLVQLSQRDWRMKKMNYTSDNQIGLYVVTSCDATHKKRYWSKEEVIVAPKFIAYRDVITELVCQPRVNYFLIPSTYRPGVEQNFQLLASSAHTFALEEVDSDSDIELKCSGRWKGITAAGRTTASPAWANNPQYYFCVKEAGCFGISLHQIQPNPSQSHYISFIIYASDGCRVTVHKSDNVVSTLDFAPLLTVFTECQLPVGHYTVCLNFFTVSKDLLFSRKNNNKNR